VSHPHLAVVHGIETWRDVPFLVEEFLAGGTLASRLTAGPLALPEVLDLGLALTDALQHLHGARLLHCDIKPSNIGYTAQRVVKLLDFGLARILREAQPPAEVETTEHPGSGAALVANSTHGALAGTPFYMSPETVRGERPTPAVDLWSLAVVLYECLTGQRPFQGGTPAEIFSAITGDRRPDIAAAWPACPPAVQALFARAFDLDPRVRFRDAAMLRPQLRALRAPTRLE
jgi:serine/threonine protein kinase